MDKLEELVLNSLSKKKKAAYVSQIGIIQNASLIELRTHIKNIMLPLLLKVFQLKIQGNRKNILDPFSESAVNEELSIYKLKALDKDIKTLMIWCHTCSKQIQEVITMEPRSSRFKWLNSKAQVHSNRGWWHRFYKKFKKKGDGL
jgi:hypothetical protein